MNPIHPQDHPGGDCAAAAQDIWLSFTVRHWSAVKTWMVDLPLKEHKQDATAKMLR